MRTWVKTRQYNLLFERFLNPDVSRGPLASDRPRHEGRGGESSRGERGFRGRQYNLLFERFLNPDVSRGPLASDRPATKGEGRELS